VNSNSVSSHSCNNTMYPKLHFSALCCTSTHYKMHFPVKVQFTHNLQTVSWRVLPDQTHTKEWGAHNYPCGETLWEPLVLCSKYDNTIYMLPHEWLHPDSSIDAEGLKARYGVTRTPGARTKKPLWWLLAARDVTLPRDGCIIPKKCNKSCATWCNQCYAYYVRENIQL